MKKTIISLFLVLCISVLSVLSTAEVAPVIWHDAKDHNRWTESMLFGNPSYHSYKPPEIWVSVEQLENALLLCIDQFNGHYEDKLETLSFIPNVPKNISSIDFPANQITHRAYTHRGWNHTYFNFEIEKSHPDIRKQLLISVVNYVFKFDKYMSSEQSKKMCDAMGCLLYNLHIIEDRYHSKNYYGAANVLLLAAEGTQTESVTHDLLECIAVLFSNQKRDTDYQELTSGIQKISDEIVSKIKKEHDTNSLLLIDRQYSEKLKNLISKYLPSMLQKQAWFTNVFYPNWNSN